MSFCEISFKRKDNSIEVKNNKGEKSPLYNSLLQYTSTNDVYTGREWFFDRLIQQSKLKSTNPSELALGLYSIAFNSGKSESYWLNKIDQLLPTKGNVVDYKIKAVEILQSDKAYQMFEKGKKNNWSLDKILSELMIPKDQKELIKEVQSEMPYYDEIPFNEQLAIEVASKYSFSVEINTATAQEPDYGSYIPSVKTNAQYYSNLTVPGGTNYTENEISTPLITPSIKGHAQFATDKGIGWFRSDDKVMYSSYEEVVRIMKLSGILKIEC